MRFATIGVHTHTGRVGRWVARTLLDRGTSIRVLGPRDRAWQQLEAERMRVRAPSLRPPSLHSVFLAPPPADSPADMEREFGVVLELLRLSSALRHVVLLSSIGAHGMDGGPGLVGRAGRFESGLVWAGLQTTCVRPAFFFENWRLPFAIATRTGYLPSIVGPIARPTPMVSLRDVGERVVAALLAPDDEPDVIEVEGPNRPTAIDVATVLGEALGRTIRPLPMSDGVVERWVRSRYRDEAHAEEWTGMLTALRAGTLVFERAVGVMRGPTSLADAVRQLQGQ